MVETSIRTAPGVLSAAAVLPPCEQHDNRRERDRDRREEDRHEITSSPSIILSVGPADIRVRTDQRAGAAPKNEGDGGAV
jgi:hypothetical protein